MPKSIDLTGKKFERLTVLERAGISKNGHITWKCKCDCGNETIVDGSSLRGGNTKSCGCLAIEKSTERVVCLTATHKMSNTRIFRIWYGVKIRCEKPYSKNYDNYGGRGIKICDEWSDTEKGFMNFYNWSMANGYNKRLSIDRIDVNGNYEPNNCRWITNKEQQRNKRNNHLITYNNKTKCLIEWASIYNILPETIQMRISRYNWSIEKALTTPVKNK
ncbi:hypothetical protein [Clostridium sporogenes]|uniref:hypothetical protein n=1 Tax=Clostridium sporogenes TaxID=1509 RepID=UPI00066523D3|nr:hypothetical protein [Clostridium sporogenes]